MEVLNYCFDFEWYDNDDLAGEFIAYCNIDYRDADGDDGVVAIRYLSTGDVYEIDYCSFLDEIQYCSFSDDYIYKNIFTDEIRIKFNEYIKNIRSRSSQLLDMYLY